MSEQALLERLAARTSGPVRAHEPLAAHTTLKVGGPAAAFVRAETADDLVAVAELCAELHRPWLVLGRGSNLLIADSGWPGVVVTLGRGFRGVEVDLAPAGPGSGGAIIAGAAEPMPTLAVTAARRGLGGLAFGVAIPGSLGGAVRMNAGAHGRELRDVLDWAEVVRLACGGVRERLSGDELAMGYRRSTLPPDAVVVRARLRLQRTDPTTLAADMAEMRRWRRAHQPISEPSCGSVFRNPDQDSAGRLIEAAGMKGYRVGGARVSEVHANFITAEPHATAADVRQVIRDVQRVVARRHGVWLRTEVVLAGFSDEPPGDPPWGRDPGRDAG